MPKPNEQTKPTQKQMPILARHAVSLAIVFVLGLVVSYFAGQAIHQRLQLAKLSSSDQATFNEALAYVVKNAGRDATVTKAALDQIGALNDTERAADLLLALAQSHASLAEPVDPVIPTRVSDAIVPLMRRLSATQAIGLYDGLVQIEGVNAVDAANHLLASLAPTSDAELLKIVDLLDTRLLWSRQWVPMDLWVRWLGVLAKSDAELTQFNTAKRIGELPEAVDDPRIALALSTLSASDYDTVRAVVLRACAGYAAIAKDPTEYEQIIFELGQDANKHIARRAWMVVGHLNPFSGFAVNWQDADPFVAEGMLWAAVKTNPENPRPAIQAMENGLQRMSWLALNQTDAISYTELSLDTEVRSPVSQFFLDEPDFIAAWRAILGSTRFAGDHEHWYVTLHEVYEGKPSPLWNAQQKALSQETFLSRYLALTYRFNEYYKPTVRELTEQETALAELAAVEGWAIDAYRPNPFRAPSSLFAQMVTAATGIHPIDLERLAGELPLDQPSLFNLFTLALLQADGQIIDRFIRSSHPQLVTMAAIAAAMSVHRPQMISGVNADLLRQHPDLTREQLRVMSNDELSSLGLRRVDALPLLVDAAESAPASANRIIEAKLLKLALWMRGDLGDNFTPTAEAMLFDEELPTSTVLMCLLHMNRPIALDYLFGDLVTPRPDLHKLFVQERFWHVFRRFVDTTELDLWLWGDPEAQAFQLEAMQQWYAVNRWKIKQGWWPELIDN